MIANLLGIDEFLPSSDFFDLMGQEECQANTTTALVCESILFLICGPDVAELDPVLISLHIIIIIVYLIYLYWLLFTSMLSRS